MGAAVGANLLRNGVPLQLFDLHGDKNVPEPLRGSLGGAVWASSAQEAAAAADVVITALPRPADVSAAFAGPRGILAGLRKGATWIEHSTTDFENTAAVRAQVEAIGGFAVEAPLTGGMQILRAGKMVTLVGANPEVLEGDIASLIALSAPRIIRCGEFGHATIIKAWPDPLYWLLFNSTLSGVALTGSRSPGGCQIFSNILCAAHDVAIGETLCVAKKAGLDMKLVNRSGVPPGVHRRCCHTDRLARHDATVLKPRPLVNHGLNIPDIVSDRCLTRCVSRRGTRSAGRPRCRACSKGTTTQTSPRR